MGKVAQMRSVLAVLAALTLAGCADQGNPFARNGNWVPTGAANETIAQQVADKSELIAGHGDATSNGVAASAGVEKALTAGTATGLQTPETITVQANAN